MPFVNKESLFFALSLQPKELVQGQQTPFAFTEWAHPKFHARAEHSNCEPRMKKRRGLNAHPREALARPNGKERQAAPGWARAFGGSPILKIRKVSRETVAEATLN